MRLPAALLVSMKVGLGTVALGSAGCEAVTTTPHSAASMLGTLPLVATFAAPRASEASATSIASERSNARIDSRGTSEPPTASEPHARAPERPFVPEVRGGAPEPERVAVAEPRPKRRHARRAVRAPEPAPKRWVCGPCGMG